jgi:hypothetical protein
MRLRTRHAGGRAYKWLLERVTGSEWRAEHVTGLLFFNYFGRRTETIRQNHQLSVRVDA